MKAKAEKSARHRRSSSVAGAGAQARFFRRVVLSGMFAATFGLGICTLAALPLAHADEPAAAPAATPAASQLPPDEIERQAEAIARSIMSPFCPGRTVSACPVAGPWREDIRHWVAEGVDSVEIKRRLAERVPEHNLGGVPKNRLGWVLPVGLGIIAFATIIYLLKRLTGGGPPQAGAGGKSSDASKSAELPAKKSKAGDEPTDAPPGGSAGTPAARGNGEDYDARLQDELETLDQ